MELPTFGHVDTVEWCLDRVQYLEDEGFTLENNSQADKLLIGWRVRESGEKFGFRVLEIRERRRQQEFLEADNYHGLALDFAQLYNKIIAYELPTTPDDVTPNPDQQ